MKRYPITTNAFVDEIVSEVYEQTGVDLTDSDDVRATGDNSDYRAKLILANAVKTPGVRDSTLIKIGPQAEWVVLTHGFKAAEEEGIRFSKDVLLSIAENEYSTAVYVLANMKSMTPEVAKAAYFSVKSAHAKSSLLTLVDDPDVIKAAVKSKSAGVRRVVANHRLLDRYSAIVLAGDKSSTVVYSLARVVKYPEAQIELIKSPHENATYYLAASNDLSAPVVRRLAEIANPNTARVLIRRYGNEYPDIVEPILDRSDPKDYRVIEQAVSVSALGLERRASISVGSRSVRVRRMFFNSLTIDELVTLSNSDDTKVKEFASKMLVKRAMV